MYNNNGEGAIRSMGMKNLVKDPHFEKNTLWVLEFHDNQKPNQINTEQIDLVFTPEFIVDKAMTNMTNLEELKRDTQALQNIEKLCENLKKECLDEIDKSKEITSDSLSDEEMIEASKKVAENLEALEELIQRFFNILNRFQPPENK